MILPLVGLVRVDGQLSCVCALSGRDPSQGTVGRFPDPAVIPGDGHLLSADKPGHVSLPLLGRLLRRVPVRRGHGRKAQPVHLVLQHQRLLVRNAPFRKELLKFHPITVVIHLRHRCLAGRSPVIGILLEDALADGRVKILGRNH